VHKDYSAFLNFAASWLCVRMNGVSFINESEARRLGRALIAPCPHPERAVSG